jgi:outer membrane protein TolC
VLAVCLFMSLPVGVSAQSACPPRCGLESLIELAEQSGPGIDRAEAEVALSEARRSEAYFAPLNLGTARFDVAPTAARRGDIGHSMQPDLSFSDDMGLFVNIRVEAALALTPWWRIVSYWRASRAAVEMSQHGADQARAEARLALERAYRDAQVAEATSDLLRTAARGLDRELSRVELLLDEDLPGADEQDRLRLVIDRTGLEARQVQVRRDLLRARARIRYLTGIGSEVRIELEPIDSEVPPLQPLEWYLEAARRLRPEVQLSLAAIRAAEALVDVGRSELVPDLAVGVFYSLRNAPLVDDQRSQFTRDPWNGVGLGYGLVYDWDLGIGVRLAQIRQGRADVEQARAMRRYALSGVGYEVEGAFVRAIEDARIFELRARALELSRGWLDSSRDAFSRGETNSDELSDALNIWLGTEQGYLEALARLHQGRAELERAAGLEPFAARATPTTPDTARRSLPDPESQR